MGDQELLVVSQAAEALSASGQTIRNWIRGDRLKGVRIGNRFLVPRAEVERLRGDVGSPVGESPWAFETDDTGVALPRAGEIARSTARADGLLGLMADSRGGAKPPYELQPGSARRGPPELWERFDEAVAELDRVSEGRSLRAVARAYAELGHVAGELAAAVEREDRASGLLPSAVRKRRRSA